MAQYLTKTCRNGVDILDQTTGYFHVDFDGVQLQVSKWRAKSPKDNKAVGSICDTRQNIFFLVHVSCPYTQ